MKLSITLFTNFLARTLSFLSPQQDFTMDMYFRQYWTDPRLRFDAAALGRDKLVLLDRDSVRRFWRPDTFFVNERKTTLPRCESFCRKSL